MLSDISHGHATGADWLFLIAAVCAFIAALAPSVVPFGKLDGVVRMGWVAVVLAAVAWLIL